MPKVNKIKLKEVNSDFPIHSVPELIIPENIEDLIGCQVVYQKARSAVMFIINATVGEAK